MIGGVRSGELLGEKVGKVDQRDHGAVDGDQAGQEVDARRAGDLRHRLNLRRLERQNIQHPVRQQLLPIEAESEGGDAGPREEYLYEPGPEAILASLLPRHVTVQVYRALMESAAGEYGARMTAMEAASKNAREMIHVLTIQYNKARQERITKELLDIVGGAEALRQSVEA